ncbi:MAG: M23 family metallopeptidase [Candidatus Eremiobacteraeota bacterium]|nr:M23 family metallopeptidase [Candidatus Eremiobacteraeota bacterium]
MNKLIARFFTLALVMSMAVCLFANAEEKQSPEKKGGISLPVGAIVEAPINPTIVRAEGKINFVYELHITNMSKKPINLKKIEVFGYVERESPLVCYKANDFKDILIRLGEKPGANDNREIKPGKRAVAYIWIALDEKRLVPDKLYHRITFDEDEISRGELAVLNVPIINVSKEKPIRIHSPLFGNGWLAAEGPININGYSHHRFGIIPFKGKAWIPQRFAIDWMKFGPDGELFHGDPSKNENWYCYGKKIHSVADGIVVEAMDGVPENVPLAKEKAVPMTLENICGNYALIDIGNGHYALYAHMIPGSVKVKKGDKVKTGQVLGLLGNSGNSTAPHLHFHISTTPSGNLLASEGLPFEIGSFLYEGKIPVPFECESIKGMVWKKKPGAKPVARKNEVPLGYKIYAFPEK